MTSDRPDPSTRPQRRREPSRSARTKQYSTEDLENIASDEAPTQSPDELAEGIETPQEGPVPATRSEPGDAARSASAAYAPPTPGGQRKPVTIRLDAETVGVLRRLMTELPGYRSESQVLSALLEPRLRELEAVYVREGWKGALLWLAEQETGR